jgi:4-hydroxythreonine-4-phosphate dehydrogenase
MSDRFLYPSKCGRKRKGPRGAIITLIPGKDTFPLTETRRVIAVTAGDAAGIGPEVVLKAFAAPELYQEARPLVIGPAAVLAAQAEHFNSQLKLRTVANAADARGEPGALDVLDTGNLQPDEVTFGEVGAACGKAAMQAIEKGVDLAVRGEVAAVVTAPINKEAVKAAGYPDTGHMRYMARLTNSERYAAMLIAGTLRVVHLTDHYSLKDAAGMITRERILSQLGLIDRSFRSRGTAPRIGVAAVNPHGGDGGLFGREEIEEIGPAVAQAREEGIDARGPFPADSVFVRALHGEFDVVLAMYHDQGHIAIKVHDFERSLAVTLGLPFIRTSVDHGTAFDIAGKGIADARSMGEAFRLAVSLVHGRLP